MVLLYCSLFEYWFVSCLGFCCLSFGFLVGLFWCFGCLFGGACFVCFIDRWLCCFVLLCVFYGFIVVWYCFVGVWCIWFWVSLFCWYVACFVACCFWLFGYLVIAYYVDIWRCFGFLFYGLRVLLVIMVVIVLW